MFLDFPEYSIKLLMKVCLLVGLFVFVCVCVCVCVCVSVSLNVTFLLHTQPIL
jgi:hypothetical protein